jgi:hypothetical protein
MPNSVKMHYIGASLTMKKMRGLPPTQEFLLLPEQGHQMACILLR